MSAPEARDLPLFPLQTVLFPGGRRAALSTDSKQRLLEMDDARERIEILRRLISSGGQ